jgi:hypothetical protein
MCYRFFVICSIFDDLFLNFISLLFAKYAVLCMQGTPGPVAVEGQTRRGWAAEAVPTGCRTRATIRCTRCLTPTRYSMWQNAVAVCAMNVAATFSLDLDAVLPISMFTF